MNRNNEVKDWKGELDYKTKKNIDVLYKHRELLEQTRIEISTSFDKYILTFAAGALYLSILFTNSSSHGCLVEKEWIFLGWTFLIVSIISMALSIFLSVKAHEKEVGFIDEDIECLRDGKEVEEHVNALTGFICFCEIIGGLSFIVGIASLSFFYFSNL